MSSEQSDTGAGQGWDVKFFNIFAIVVALGFIATVCAVMFWPAPKPPPTSFYSGLELGDFNLIERSGREVSSTELEGKKLVVGFVFTSCGIECTISGETMAAIDAKLGPRDDVRLVSLTIDPMTDTPSVLSTFAESLNADTNRWFFLTGEKAIVEDTLQTSFLAKDEEDGIVPVLLPKGRLPLVSRLYLVDAAGRVRSWYDSTSKETPDQMVEALLALDEEKEKTYATKGVIHEIAPDGKTALIQHEEIPGYMAMMTMKFKVRDTNEVRNLRIGDEITFDLVVTKDTHWIEDLIRVGTVDISATQAASSKPKDKKEPTFPEIMPDFEFLDETGKTVQFSDFEGNALAFTFIFSRCPLPDYCPLMGNQFFKARQLMQQSSGGTTNWQFLSISFDPEFDTPEVLSGYADHYRKGNDDRWRFAVASKETLKELAPLCDLMLMEDKRGSINHNLRTVVLDGKRKVHRVFPGNEWTAEELAEALAEAAGSGGS